MRRARSIAIYRDNIRMSLVMLERKVPLTQQQRETITEVLIKDTKPPEYYGQRTMNYYVVFGKMAEKEAEVKELFLDAEWKVVGAILRQAKAMQRTLQLQAQAWEGEE